MTFSQRRMQAHNLLDVLPEEKLGAVFGLLEVLIDPVARSLANAPWEDEEIDEEEERAVAESKAWIAANPGKDTPHEELLVEFGFTDENAERIAHMPPALNGSAR